MIPLQPSTVQRRYPLRYWLLVAYCVGLPSFVRFDASGRTHDQGLMNPTSLGAVLFFLLAASLLALFSLLNRQKLLQRKIRFSAPAWLLLCAIFIVATLLAPTARLTPSKATDFPLAMFRLGEFVLTFLLLLSVYTREEEERATDLVIRLIGSICWITIGMVWVALPVVPSLVYGEADDIASAHARLGGAFVNPVYLSVLAGIGFFYALFFMRTKLKIFCCSLSFVTLMLTYARSEQLLFFIALFAYLIFFSRSTILRWTGLVSVLSAVALAGAFFEQVLTYLERGHGLRSVTTLSERTDVWTASMKAFWMRPFLGYGYIIGVKNAIKDHWNATNWVPPHSHDEFIQALVTGGIFAGLITLWIYGRVLWSAIRQFTRDPQHVFLLIALIQLIGMGIITPLLSYNRTQLSSLFLVIYVGVIAGEPVRVRVSRRLAPRAFAANRAAHPVPVAMRWRQPLPPARRS